MVEILKRIQASIKFFLVRVLLTAQAYRYVYYVGSTEVLPPPLSADEEGLLISRLENGDLSVKSSLIEPNLRLVVYIAKNLRIRNQY